MTALAALRYAVPANLACVAGLLALHYLAGLSWLQVAGSALVFAVLASWATGLLGRGVDRG